MEPSSTTGDSGDSSKQSDATSTFIATNHKDAILMCCICQNVLTSKKAKLLPCLHTLCSPCEITAMNDGRLKCLCCNQVWKNTDITDHYLFNQMDLGLDIPKCEVCTEKNLIAKFKCQECGDFLCGECGRAHHRVKMTKDHHLKEVETNVSNDTKCSIHTTEDLAWFCVTCDELTCNICQLQSHVGHQYKAFEEQSEIFRQDLRKMLDDNNRRSIRVDQIKQYASGRVNEVNSCETTMRQELKQTITQIQHTLTSRANELLGNIERCSQSKRRAYMEIKSAMETIQSMTKQANFFMEAALSSTNDVALHRVLKTVLHSLNVIGRLEQEKKHSINSELQVPVQMSLKLNPAQLVENIRALGDIIVDRISQTRTESGSHHLAQQLAAASAIDANSANFNRTAPHNYASPRQQSQQFSFNQMQQNNATVTTGPIARPTYRNRAPAAISPRQGQGQNYNVPVTSSVQNNTGYIGIITGQRLPNQLQPQQVVNQQRAVAQQQPAVVAQQQQQQQHQQYLIASLPAGSAGSYAQHMQQQQASQLMQQQHSPQLMHQQQSPQLIQQQQSSQRMIMTVANNVHMPRAANCNVDNQMRMQQSPHQSAALAHHAVPVSYPYQQRQPNPSSVFIQQMSQMAPNYGMQMPPAYGSQQNITGSTVVQQGMAPPHQQQILAQQQYNYNSQMGQMQASNVGHMPRLQYGPSRSQTSQPSPASSSPTISQTPYNPPHPTTLINQLQRAPDPIQLSCVPRLLSTESLNKNQPTNVIRAQVVNFQGDNAVTSTNTGSGARKPAVVVQLSPTPSSENTDDLLRNVITESLSTALAKNNVISTNKDATKLVSPVANVAQEQADNDLGALIGSSTSSKPTASSDTPSPLLLNQKAVSRLAKKSIARMMDLNGKEATNKSIGQQMSEVVASLNASSGSHEKLSRTENDFPMTQAFVPTSDDEYDDAVFNDESISKGSNVSASCMITPLVLKERKSNSESIGKPVNIFERVTPDASIVSTTTDNGATDDKQKREHSNKRNHLDNNEASGSQDDNRWDDYCSVCQNGGDLICCEALTCSRVFHGYHHVPQYNEIPTGEWNCGFCVNPKDFRSAEDKIPSHERSKPGLTPYEQKSCERILLELYCDPESPPFHTPVEASVPNYYETIRHPMDFSKIREKLNPTVEYQHKYTSVEEYLNDLNRVFINCDIFNEAGSDTGKSGKLLAEKYTTLVKDHFPELIHLVQTTNKVHKLTISLNKRKRRRVQLDSDSEEGSSTTSSKRSSPYPYSLKKVE